MVESSGLLNRRSALKRYRGFESLPLRQQFLSWFHHHKRDLPWRTTRDPYAIWVSEVMLQQTRAAVVVPYYQRFISAFPTIDALANADESSLLKAWAGLGYYSRARNLQRAARTMTGGFPTTYEDIRALPGVGDYTAAAVASIAFGLPHAAVDGNVLRVLSRVLAEGGDIKSGVVRARLQTAADRLLDRKHPGDFNQAMMELGATVCLPRKPQCLLCPFESVCQGRKQGIANQLPVKASKREGVKSVRTFIIARSDDCLFMRHLNGFWELPELSDGVEAEVTREVGTFRHCITFNDYTIRVVEGTIMKPAGHFRLMTCKSLANLPLSTITRKSLSLK